MKKIQQLTWGEIGRQFDIPERYVQRLVTKAFPNEVFGRIKKYPDSLVEKAVSLKEKGKTYQAIAKELNILSDYVARDLIKFRIAGGAEFSRSKKVRKNEEELEEINSPRPIENVRRDSYIRPVTREQMMAGNAKVAKIWEDQK